METNELLTLLVAAQVRSLAGSLRLDAAHAARDNTNCELATFLSQHPLAEYVPAALQSLRDVASLMPAQSAARMNPNPPAAT